MRRPLTIQTIMMENICSELPDMYAMIACIGSCLAGPSAISHDFFNFNVSVSSSVGGFRAAACRDFCRPLSQPMDRSANQWILTCFPDKDLVDE